MTKTLALDYARKGITANTVPPFVIDSPMLRNSRPTESSQRLSISPRHTRWTSWLGDDVAAVCSFLCSEGAGYVNGQVIGVNGGAVV